MWGLRLLDSASCLAHLATNRSAFPRAECFSISATKKAGCEDKQVRGRQLGKQQTWTCSIDTVKHGGQVARGSTLALAGLPAQPEQACHLSWGEPAQLSQHELVVPSQLSLKLQVRPFDSN